MNNSILTNNQSDIIRKNETYNQHRFSQSEVIGIIVAVCVIAFIITIVFCLFIYHKYKMKLQKKHAHSLTSNNPCYVSGPIMEFDSNNSNMSHAHCNMSVMTDFYDIDELNSLDNDSFLNSLENAIFVGYLNHNRPTYSVNHSLSQISSVSTVNSAQHLCNKNEQRSSKRSANVTNNSHSKKHSSGQPNLRGSVQLRNKKTKRAVSAVDSSTDISRPRNKSETGGCEITRSTSNLISSKLCLTASIDSVCDSSRGSNQIAEVASQYKLEEQISRDTNIDNKTESSTDSRTSVNSSSAMMSSYLAENNAPNQILPDLINSSLPKSAKHKRVSSAYSNIVNKDDYIFSNNPRTGQILDPLRAGQTFNFSNDNADSSQFHRHEHHLSHNFGISNIGVFDYNVSS